MRSIRPPLANFPRIPPVMKLLSDGSQREGIYDRRFVPCLHISHTERGREGGNETNYAKACSVTAIIVEHIKMRVRNTYSTLFFPKRTMCQGRNRQIARHI